MWSQACLLPLYLNPNSDLMEGFSTPLTLKYLWARLSAFGLRLLPKGEGNALPSLHQEDTVLL